MCLSQIIHKSVIFYPAWEQRKWHVKMEQPIKYIIQIMWIRNIDSLFTMEIISMVLVHMFLLPILNFSFTAGFLGS
jgi:hypothetical protein